MNVSAHEGSVRQEEDVLPPRLLVYILIAVLVFSFILGTIAYLLLRSRESALRPSGNYPEIGLRVVPTMIRPETKPFIRLDIYTEVGQAEVLEREATESLKQLEQLDDDRRMVRVPIDVAMDLVANSKGE